MCVAVVLAPETELSVEEINKMMRANGDGAGFAWADGTSVQWFKALDPDPEKVHWAVNKRRQYPRLLHFRLATAGGIKVELCHPFEVGPKAASSAQGSGSKVLIHNGHWYRWNDIFDLYKREDLLPDTGPWSDTRFAAFVASGDPDWLEVVGGKVAVMDYEGTIKMYGSWDNLRDGIKVSNTVWQSHTYNYTRSGSHRHMMGWGWTNKEWEEYEKHEKDKRERAAKELEDESKRQKEQTPQGETSKETSTSGNSRGVWEGYNHQRGNVGVGAGYRHGQALQTPDAAGGNLGRNYGGGNGEGKRDSLGQASSKENGKEGQSGQEIYDHTPWQNPATKEWWFIPWDCEHSGRSRFEKISEVRARTLLGQAATAGTPNERDEA